MYIFQICTSIEDIKNQEANLLIIFEECNLIEQRKLIAQAQ